MNVEELYQEIIIDHSRHPRNEGSDSSASHIGQGYNPLCGDAVKLYIRIRGDHIERVSFEAEGCAISRASASLLTELLAGKTMAEGVSLVRYMRDTLLGNSTPEPALGDAVLLANVKRFPTRIKCALLPWNTLLETLEKATDGGGEAKCR